MDFLEQLQYIRKKRHEDYQKYLVQQEELEKKKQREFFLMEKYKFFFSDQKNRAAIIIQRFVKRYYFDTTCINDDEISQIPAIYRFRIMVTSQHGNPYTEKNVSPKIIGTYRNSYRQPSTEKLFRYCFDIRDIYPKRNESIEISGIFIYLQPDDHIRINKIWERINGSTDTSIRYLTDFEYYKSLSKDLVSI